MLIHIDCLERASEVTTYSHDKSFNTKVHPRETKSGSREKKGGRDRGETSEIRSSLQNRQIKGNNTSGRMQLFNCSR